MLHVLLTAVLLVFPALVIVGGVTDLTSYRIPNWISLALLAAFVPAAGLAFLAGAHWQGLALCVAVGAATLVVGVVMFVLRWLGGGDAKLLAAAALWIGWPGLGIFLAATCLAGGALALLLIALRSVWMRGMVLNAPAWVQRLGEPGGHVPYGVAIAVGALAAFPGSPLAAGL